MSQFLQDVKQSMVNRGWGIASANVEVNDDAENILSLHTKGLSADGAASE